MLISIEGNIGSGKSTLVKWLRNEFKNDERFIFIDEPLNMWLNNIDENGENMLNKFYNDQQKYGFAFQVMSYTSKMHLVKKALLNNPNKIIITERCIHTDKEVFSKMLYNEGKIETVCYNIYQTMFNEFLNDLGVDKFIYVNTQPEICYNRVKKRKREEEDGIPFDYLNICDKYHQEWVNNLDNVLKLDGNNEFEKNEGLLEKWKNKILSFVGQEENKNGKV